MWMVLYRLEDGALGTELHRTRELADAAIVDIREAGYIPQLVEVKV